jgi:pimeloyl-ACP methyl ester carboxylesterase
MVHDARTGYADLDGGLHMYYEVHGPEGEAAGRPLVLLHGAFGTVEGWAPLLPTLAATRRVITVEQQGHGRTADIDRPLSPERMADDTAALLRSLGAEGADVFGYSMGGLVALGVAVRHPGLTGRVAILGARSGALEEAYEPQAVAQFQAMPDDFAPDVLTGPYRRVAPDPSRWPDLVRKFRASALGFAGYTPDDLRAIRSPVLIMQGDRDGVRPEHAVEMFRLIPDARLAFYPGGDHFLPWSDSEWVLSTLTRFLNEKDPAQ